MAEATEMYVPPVEASKIRFHGSPTNLIPGTAMLLSSAAAFMMGLTSVFFAEAMAWTFAIWGALLLYGNLLDLYEQVDVTEEALVVTSNLRFWGRKKSWEWAHIDRLEVNTKRKDNRPEDSTMFIYYAPPGEVAIEREDRSYVPELARLIIERAGLKAEGGNTLSDLSQLPAAVKTTYVWKK